MLHGPKRTQVLARQLRGAMSLREALLWPERRRRPDGLIPAHEVLADMDAVVRHIIDAARGNYPSTAFGGPPPPPGEE